ncbi:MAG: DUF1801 domain-containing protein [Hyphomicrobiales bacterium]|nr:DUF1801 domain-containing protein [Hyphomicrobiales bacterium]
MIARVDGQKGGLREYALPFCPNARHNGAGLGGLLFGGWTLVQSTAKTVDAYLDGLTPERRRDIALVRDVVRGNLPNGYEEMMSFGMIAYVVPLSRFPKAHNKQPLMYAALAAQKHHMAVYLTNIYADGEVAAWFAEAYKATGKRMDVGKSCVRFRKLDDLPLALIGEAIARTKVDDFLRMYERSREKTAR